MCGSARVRLTSGVERASSPSPSEGIGAPTFEVGDRVAMGYVAQNPEASSTSPTTRGTQLWMLLVAFVLAVPLRRWRGVFALLGWG